MSDDTLPILRPRSGFIGCDAFRVNVRPEGGGAVAAPPRPSPGSRGGARRPSPKRKRVKK